MISEHSPWTSPVRQRLARGETVVALTVVTPSIEAVAHAATLGFHALWVELEHSPISLESLRLMVLATRSTPCAILARVPVNELWTAKRVLDQGVSGVVFPFTGSAEMAQRAAAACRYPPAGRRGSGAGLAAATWPAPGNYYDSADANVLVIAVIEDRAGVEAADAIAATPGVDVVFVGPSDLAFSLGYRGNESASEVQEAIGHITAAAQKHGKYLGRTAPTPEHVTTWQKRGFRFFQAVTELGLLTLGATAFLRPLGVSGLPATQRALY